MEKEKVLTTLDQIRVYSDPYRIEILFAFQRFDRPATCKEIADSMNEVPAKVYYHIKKMEKADILKLVYTKDVNGIIAKYYEPTAEDFEIKQDFKGKDSINTMLGETYLNTLNQIFDKAKSDFLKIIQKSAENHRKGKGVVQYSEVLLTDDEAEELHEYIDKIIKERENEKNKNYRVFFSMIKSKE
ncbi:helix-turn-helix domain-containing protein [Clostridium neuense]|uniref:Helix-turn-helix domain-containing protein n=1 Tax=Clostridium neuense TaxID=1728934 RepID=A0ABW8TDG7_9CLOT